MLCSCYVPSRSSSNRINKKKILHAEKRSSGDEAGVIMVEELNNNNNNNNNNGAQEQQDKSINNYGFSSNLKSNLKKTKMVDLEFMMRSTTVERKKVVTWSDAHAKDIALVQEFEPSTASEDGELEGVHNSCVCTIQ